MIRSPVGQSQHLLLCDVIGEQRTVVALHHKLIAAAIAHHMRLHTIAHEQVTHLWLQVHLLTLSSSVTTRDSPRKSWSLLSLLHRLGIRILSYRHTYSSLFIYQASPFSIAFSNSSSL